jgi:transcriptional regulator with XRE-family HTH domain
MNLKQYIFERKLTQGAVARKFGISDAMVCRLLQNKRKPSPALQFLIKARTKGKVTEWN